MNKINFLNRLCSIKTEPKVNAENFDKAMSHDTLLNAAYDAFNAISKTHESKGDIVVNPIDFRELEALSSIDIPFRFSSRSKTPIEECGKEFSCDGGLTGVITENPNATGYILTIKE